MLISKRLVDGISQVILTLAVHNLVRNSDIQYIPLTSRELSVFIFKESLLSDSVPFKLVFFSFLVHVFASTPEDFLHVFNETISLLYNEKEISSQYDLRLLVSSLRIGSHRGEYVAVCMELINFIFTGLRTVDERVDFRNHLHDAGMKVVLAHLSPKVKKFAKAYLEVYDKLESDDEEELDSVLKDYKDLFRPIFDKSPNCFQRALNLVRATDAQVPLNNIAKHLLIIASNLFDSHVSVSKISLIEEISYKLALLENNKQKFQGENYFSPKKVFSACTFILRK